MDLNEIRQDIDNTDRKLVDLFCRRMALAAKVASYKKEHNMEIFVPEREQQILISAAEQAGPEMADYVRRLYQTLFELSRDYQAEVLK